jgi:hypothetical protein
MQVLTDYKGKLMALADKLIAEETVESEEFEKLFDDLPPKENLHGIVLTMPGFPGFPAAPSSPTAPAPPEATPPAAPSPEPSPS